MKKSKKNERIFLLPQFPADSPIEEFRDFFMKNWELATTLDYAPASLEELKRIDYMDLKIVMEQNECFYNAAVSLGTDECFDQFPRDVRNCLVEVLCHGLDFALVFV